MNLKAITGFRPTPAGLFLSLALILYPAFALVTPPFQTPDEHQHLFRAWQLSRFQLHGERRGSKAGGMIPPALMRAAKAELGDLTPHASRPIPERTPTEALARATPIPPGEPPKFANFLGAVTYSPMGYMPQVIAIWTGEAFGASVETIVRLGRLLNCALTIGLILAALRLSPVGRLAIMAVALAPMTIACSASFGQDGLVVGTAFLLTALGLRAALAARWRARDFALALAAGVAITVTKIVYAPLIAVSALPVPRDESASRWLGRIVLLLLAAVLPLAAWLLSVDHLAGPARPGVPAPGEQLQYALAHPFEAIGAILRPFLTLRSYLTHQIIGVFGWLNVGPNPIAMLFVPYGLAVPLLAGDPRAADLGRKRRIWSLLLAVSGALGISAILYLTYSPIGATLSVGLQGRYFLPLLPLTWIALLPARRILPDEIPASLLTAVLMGIASLASLATLAAAYYR